MMFGKLFDPLAMKIAAGVGLVLFVALGIMVMLYRGEKADHNDTRDALAMEKATHAVTRSSLATLESELGKMVRDGELRAERLAEAMEEQDERSAALREQAERIRADGAAGGDPCATPDAVRNAGGL